MGTALLSPEIDTDRLPVHRDCFDIEVEIRYWQLQRIRFDLPPVRQPQETYVELIRFAYDGYMLHAGLEFGEAAQHLKKRLTASRLRFYFDWNDIEPVCKAVWRRVAAAGD